MSLGGSSGDFTLIGASVRLSHHFGSGSTRLRTKFPFSAALASTALTIQRQVARGFLLWTGADREPATPPGGSSRARPPGSMSAFSRCGGFDLFGRGCSHRSGR